MESQYNTVQYNTNHTGAAEPKTRRMSGFEVINYAPYIALTGELWDLSCGDLGEYWPFYNESALYPFCISRFRGDCYAQLWY